MAVNNQLTPNKQLPNRYILLIMSIICVICIVLVYTGTDVGSPFRVAAGYVFTPIEKGVNVVGTWMYDRSNTLKTMDDLRAENEDLKEQVSDLEDELSLLREQEYELERLQDLYDIDSMYKNYETTGANVIAKATSSWFNTFTIDKGSNQGLEVGMNVLADGGLCGIVTEVTPNFATVSSIIDDSVNVSGQVLSTGDNCIVSGSLSLMSSEDCIRLSNLNDKSDVVTVGDQIVVSNISDKFMPGIIIGYVSELSYDDNNIVKSGKLTPAVDFRHLNQVLVINGVKKISDSDENSEGTDDVTVEDPAEDNDEDASETEASENSDTQNTNNGD